MGVLEKTVEKQLVWAGNEWNQIFFPEDPDFGDYNLSDSSVETIGVCYACDSNGSRGLMCDAPGCEDGNCIYK